MGHPVRLALGKGLDSLPTVPVQQPSLPRTDCRSQGWTRSLERWHAWKDRYGGAPDGRQEWLFLWSLDEGKAGAPGGCERVVVRSLRFLTCRTATAAAGC